LPSLLNFVPHAQLRFATSELVSPTEPAANIIPQGKTGIVCVKTKRALIVAHYGETVQPGEAAKVAETIADKLIAATY
jgi:hypothetical protein